MNSHGIQYRDYQCDARDAAFGEFDAGIPSTLIVKPTGTGKTVLAGMCIEEALCGHGRRSLFVAHRETLITQAYKTFCRFGFETAVEMGSQDARKHEALVGKPDVVVGSVQTLQDDRLLLWNPNSFGLIIIDECHRALTDMYTKLLNHFDGYWLLGITATPSRGDRRNLGSRFQTKAYEYRLRQAIQEQWLVPIRTRTCKVTIDLRGLRVGGDFNTGDLEERIGPNIEKIAREFLKQREDRRGACFLPDVGSAMAFAQVLTDLGCPARYAAGSGGRFGMSRADKNATLEAFHAGEFEIITCCELLTEGWDCPSVEVVGIIRPTLQQYRYTQMVGRGTRPSPDTGKVDLLVLDFDWETDPEVKELCSVFDIFDDGQLDENVFAMAKQVARERAVDVNPLDCIEESERIIRTRQRFNIKLTGAEAKWDSYEFDPVGVAKILDIKLNRKYDLDKKGRNPATDAQLGMLKFLGIEAPEGLTKWGASKMIDKIKKRQEKGYADASQVQRLLVNGVNPDLARVMGADEARKALREIESARLTQGSLF